MELTETNDIQRFNELLSILKLTHDSPELQNYFPDIGEKTTDEKIIRVTNYLDMLHETKFNETWNTNFIIFPMDLFGRLRGFPYLEKFYGVPMFIRGFTIPAKLSIRQMIDILNRHDNFTISFYGLTHLHIKPGNIISNFDRKAVSFNFLLDGYFITPIAFNNDIYSGIVFTISVKSNTIEYVAYSRLNNNCSEKMSITKFIHDGYTLRYVAM